MNVYVIIYLFNTVSISLIYVYINNNKYIVSKYYYLIAYIIYQNKFISV